MFKKLKSLFSLEARLISGVGVEISKLQREVDASQAKLKQSVVDQGQSLNKVRAEILERLSKIEVLFADEIDGKEKLRIEKIRAARKKEIGLDV